MVDGTERDREFVADFESKASRLCEAEVMSMARRSAANETGLLGHVSQVLLRSDPLWLADLFSSLATPRPDQGCDSRRHRLMTNSRTSEGCLGTLLNNESHENCVSLTEPKRRRFHERDCLYGIGGNHFGPKEGERYPPLRSELIASARRSRRRQILLLLRYFAWGCFFKSCRLRFGHARMSECLLKSPEA